MITITKASVPAFLHASEFYLSLPDDASIEIPNNCFKVDTSVRSMPQLSNMLSVVRFWGLPEIPASCLSFIFKNYTPKMDKLLSCYDHDLRILPEVKTIHNARNRSTKLNVACSSGRIEFVRHFVDDGCMVTREAFRITMEKRLFDCFQYLLKDPKTLCFMTTCDLAASLGLLEYLTYAHTHKCTWGLFCTLGAAAGGHLDCLTYAVSNGCDVNTKVLTIAVEHGHVDCVTYLLSNARIPDVNLQKLCRLAAAKGHHRCLQLLHERGTRVDDSMMVAAAKAGSVDCLRYLREHDCMWSGTVTEILAEHGHVECLAYARSTGGTITPNAASLAAAKGHLHCLKYLLEQVYPAESLMLPVAQNTLRAAAANGHVSCLKHAKSRMGQWDCTITAAAARFGKLQCLQYLLQSGCPVDETACIAAASGGHLHCVQYLYKRGLRIQYESWCKWSDEVAAFVKHA